MRTPAATAARTQQSRHNEWWYPQRCEHPGCSETRKEKLKKCSACKMVQYCCKEHQAVDWGAHKEECKVFQRVGLHSTFYTDEDMLSRFPLTPADDTSSSRDNVPLGSSCSLCGKDDRQEDMTRTRCCNQVICDNSDQYQLCSYSREFCERSHERYTLCGAHGSWSDKCDDSKDWRECPGCVRGSNGVADTLWRGLNSYNFAPLLSKDVPHHARCDTCAKCRKKYISGMEGCSSLPGEDGMCCLACSHMQFGDLAAPGRVCVSGEQLFSMSGGGGTAT